MKLVFRVMRQGRKYGTEYVVEVPRADDGEGTCSVCQGLCTEVDGREGKYYYCDRSMQAVLRSTPYISKVWDTLYMQIQVNIEV